MTGREKQGIIASVIWKGVRVVEGNGLDASQATWLDQVARRYNLMIAERSNRRVRKGRIVVECTCLENRRPERVRGFESHPFRHIQ